MGESVLLNRIAQGLDDVVLSQHIIECLGTILSSEYLIAHKGKSNRVDKLANEKVGKILLVSENNCWILLVMDDPRPQQSATPPSLPAQHTKKAKRGVLNPKAVRNVAFYVITLCILVSVTVSILAIWDFAKDGALWRTVATCLVIASGAAVFSVINVMFGDGE